MSPAARPPAEEPKNTTIVQGGNFTGANTIGDHNEVHVGSVVYNAAAGELDSLRAKVGELGAELTGSAREEFREARRHLEVLQEELADDEPRPHRLKSRWEQLEPLVRSRAELPSVATIDNMVRML
ncbi:MULTISPECIES: hypothetical protein [unclassified Saccharopolyspora]|uniref:hypothetical protein n=1 Tax=Saccharopolyspora TaxID=1835 RepID=UPI00190972EB|nr:hypothetical protein [Saccharopolyspora sp. HNM0986]MBK0866299.1 hypothetical protein [Saccharopolyspora sp. HNM0986]